MSWQPITLEELKALGKRIDAEYVFGDDEEQLYRQLNEKYPHEKWTMLRSPDWCGDKLVALVVSPREE